MHLNDLLTHAVRSGASDIHIKVGSYPMMRIDGVLLVANETRRLERDDTETMAATVLTLKVDIGPPPVPQVSSRMPGRPSMGSQRRRRARAAALISVTVSPFMRSAVASAAICAAEAPPESTSSMASVASSSSRSRPLMSARSAPWIIATRYHQRGTERGVHATALKSS